MKTKKFDWKAEASIPTKLSSSAPDMRGYVLFMSEEGNKDDPGFKNMVETLASECGMRVEWMPFEEVFEICKKKGCFTERFEECDFDEN